MSSFEKYRTGGAYHWNQADRRWNNRAFNPPLLARYIALLRLMPDVSHYVLDVGCGDGYLMHCLLASGRVQYAFGVDTSQIGLSLAHERLTQQNYEGNWSVSAAFGEMLPVLDNSFDVVTFADVIEHLEQPERTLAEVYRVLTDDGTLLVSTPNWNPQRKWDKLHVKEFKPDELEALLKRHFSHVYITACWPMRWFWRWTGGGAWRRAIDVMARLGYNPFLTVTKRPTPAYGQLLAVCRKSEMHWADTG